MYYISVKNLMLLLMMGSGLPEAGRLQVFFPCPVFFLLQAFFLYLLQVFFVLPAFSALQVC